MPKNLKSNFATFIINKIREKRIEKGLSQDDIAIILNVSRGFIGQIESSNFPSKYSLDQINLIAREFKCSPKDFMPDEPI